MKAWLSGEGSRHDRHSRVGDDGAGGAQTRRGRPARRTAVPARLGHTRDCRGNGPGPAAGHAGVATPEMETGSRLAGGFVRHPHTEVSLRSRCLTEALRAHRQTALSPVSPPGSTLSEMPGTAAVPDERGRRAAAGHRRVSHETEYAPIDGVLGEAMHVDRGGAPGPGAGRGDCWPGGRGPRRFPAGRDLPTRTRPGAPDQPRLVTVAAAKAGRTDLARVRPVPPVRRLRWRFPTGVV